MLLLKSIFYRHVNFNWPYHTHTLLTKTDTSNILNTMADPSYTFTSDLKKQNKKLSKRERGKKSDHNANRYLAVKSCSITIVPLKRNSKALQLSHSEKEGSQELSLYQTAFENVHYLWYELILRIFYC